MSDPRYPASVSSGGFSATDAAFEGFKLVRRDWKSVLAWSLLSLVFTLVMVVGMVVTIGPAMTQMSALQPALGQPAPDPARSFALLQQMAPFWLLVFLVSLLFYGVLYAAVNRAVLRPGPSFGHLGFGVDELLQVATLLIVWVALFLVYVVGLIITVIVGAGLTAASKPLGVLGFVVGGLLTIAALFYFMVKLSLLSPLVLDKRRMAIGEAWRLTRGRFWPLLGAYALAFVLFLIITIVLFSITGALAMTVAGASGAGGALMHPNMSSLGAYFGPVQIINIVVTSAFYGLVFAVLLGAPAGAYAQLTRGQRVADVFGEPTPDASTRFGAPQT